jgi:hypothetical protein
MTKRVIIDGNNLLFALRDHAPLPPMGRETLAKLLDAWSRKSDVQVTLVFDGASPGEGMIRQMATSRVRVRFSAPRSADDVIADLLRSSPDPDHVRLVSGDSALRQEALQRRCRHCDSVAFVRELCARPGAPPAAGGNAKPEKPAAPSGEDVDYWVRQFGSDTRDGPGGGPSVGNPPW